MKSQHENQQVNKAEQGKESSGKETAGWMNTWRTWRGLDQVGSLSEGRGTGEWNDSSELVAEGTVREEEWLETGAWPREGVRETTTGRGS